MIESQVLREFVESSNDYRIRALWDKLREQAALLQQVAWSPVDMVNDGECCMRLKQQVLLDIIQSVETDWPCVERT